MTSVPTPIRYLDEISHHIKMHFGSDIFVLHEKRSSTIHVDVHVDVHVVRPNSARPFFTLLTSGMSDLDMRVPQGMKDLALAELCLCLPGNWPLSMRDFGWKGPRYYWPIAILGQAARYPHIHKTWFSWGHTIGSSDQPESLDTEGRFTGIMLTHPQTFPKGVDTVETQDGRLIHYLAVVPLLRGEVYFREHSKVDTFARRLLEADVTELLDPERSSVV